MQKHIKTRCLQPDSKSLQQPGSSFQDIDDLDWQSQFGTASASLGGVAFPGGRNISSWEFNRERSGFSQQNVDSANGKQRFGMTSNHLELVWATMNVEPANALDLTLRCLLGTAQHPLFILYASANHWKSTVAGWESFLRLIILMDHRHRK